eukprot:jgi/Mesen1/9535/ME000064S08883
MERRNYSAEAGACELPRERAATHPLGYLPGAKPHISRTTPPPAADAENEEEEEEHPDGTIVDPLLSSPAQLDPLSRPQDGAQHHRQRHLLEQQQEEEGQKGQDGSAGGARGAQVAPRKVRGRGGGASSSSSSGKSEWEEKVEATGVEWDHRKAALMQRFASTGTIRVSASFDVIATDARGRGGRPATAAARLQELEDPGRELAEETKLISQHDYVAKLLADTSVPQFYPTLFVLVTDVMDTVGSLVWTRIKHKAETDDSGRPLPPLPANFTCADVRREARQTCANWLHKIGSIRDLLPRLCMHFLEPSPPVAVFQRLAASMRGLSDPMAAAYARLYLARKGRPLLLSPSPPPGPPGGRFLAAYSEGFAALDGPVPSGLPHNFRGHIMMMLEDYLAPYRRVLAGHYDSRLREAGVERSLYLALLEPALEYI